MEYIRHLMENGDWAFSNVKSVGQLSLLTTTDKQDLVSAINEINQYFSLNDSSLQDLVKAVSDINSLIEGLGDTIETEQQKAVEYDKSVQEKIALILSNISATETNLNDKIVESEGKIENLKSKAEQIQADLSEGYETLDGKIVKVGSDLVNTNAELSSKMNKTEYDDSVGVNNWIASFFNVIGGFSTKYPKVDDFIGLQANSVEEVKDSVMLYPFNKAKTGILHLFTNIRQDVEKTVTLSIQHTDGMSVLLNGGYVYYQAGTKTANVSISLRAGWNTVEILLGVDNKIGKISANSKLSDLVYKMTSKIGVGNKNDTRLTQAETLIKQTNDSIVLKADKTVVEGLGNQISDNTAQIEVNAEAIESKVSKDDFDTYTGRLESAETKITQTATQIESLATKTELDTLNGVITDAQSLINQTASEVALKASKEELETVSGNVSSLESELSVQAGQIQSKVASTTFNSAISKKEDSVTKSSTAPATKVNGTLWLDTSKTPNILKRWNGSSWINASPTTAGDVGAYSQSNGEALAGRISTAETSITQTQKEIALKASQTDLDAMTGRVGSVESSLTLQAGQIQSKVGQTEVNTTVSNAVDGIKIGGRNFARGFLSGWFKIGGTVTLTPKSNSQAVLEGNSSSSSRYATLAKGIEGNTEYTISLNAIESSGTYLVIRQKSNELADRTSQLAIMGIGGSAGNYSLKEGKRELTFTTSADTKSILIELGSDAIAANFKVEVKDIKLEKGNKVTDWTPAPEDIDASIAAKADGSTVEEIEKRMKTAETSITQTQESIELRAKSTDVYTKTETNTELAKKATPTDITNAVNGINIGGRNLAVKSGGTYLAPTTYSSGVQTIDGKKTLVFDNSNNIAYLGVNTSMVELGKEYTFSFYAKADTQLNLKYVYISSKNTGYAPNTTVSTQWKRYSFTFVAKATELISPHMYPIIKNEDGTYKKFYVTEWKLEEGNKATDWTPAPEDVDTSIAAKADNSVVTALEKRVVAAETSITQTSSDITLKANATDVYTKTETNTELAKKATPTDITNAVNDISVGGRNLLENSAKPVYKKSRTQTTGNYKAFAQFDITHVDSKIEVGEDITISFDVKMDIGQNLRVYDTNNSNGKSFGTKHFYNFGSDWTRLSWTLKVGSIVKGSYHTLDFYCADTYNELFELKNIKIEKGNKATDWTPAPEDVEQNMLNRSENLVTKDVIHRINSTLNLNEYLNNGKITVTTKGGTDGVYALLPLKSNTEYVMSFSYQKKQGSLLSFGGHLDRVISNFKETYVDGVNTGLQFSEYMSAFVGDDELVHKVVTKFKTTDDVANNRRIFIQPNRGNATETDTVVEITNWQIEEGYYPSPWNLNPTDLTTRIKETEASLTVQADQIQSKVSQREIDESIGKIKVGGRNLITGDSAKEYPFPIKEFTPTHNLAPIFEKYGLGIEYTISFDIKSKDISKRAIAQVYSQNSNGTRYDFGMKYVPVTTQWVRQSVVVVPQLSSLTETQALLSFYGVYDTGNILSIKNVQVELGNIATDYNLSPEEFEDVVNKKISSSESSITQKSNEIALRVSGIETENIAYKNSTGTDKDWSFKKAISKTGWYRIASNAGNRAMAEFQINDTTSSKHATAIFNAGIMFGNQDNITLTGFSLYSTNPFPKARIVKQSTYEPPYLEIYVQAPADIEVFCRKNTQLTGWSKVEFTEGEIPTGYTAREFNLDRDSVTDVTSQNTSKDTSNVNGVPSKTVINRITAAETSITQTQEAITLAATKTDLEAVGNRVSTAEASLTVQAGQIQSKVSQTDFTTGMGSKENSVVKSNTAPTTKVLNSLWLDTSKTPNILKRWNGSSWINASPTTAGDVGAYSQSNGEALAKRVTSTETSITQTQEAIDLRATKTEVETLIGDVRVGGRNLVLGSAESASSSAYLVKSYNLSEDWIVGQEYTISIWGDVEPQSSQRFGAWGNGSASQLSVLRKDADGVHRATFKVASTPSVAGQNSGIKKLNIYNTPSTTATTSNITKIKVEKGNKATDWTPAPEDVDTSIGELGKRVSTAEASLTVQAGQIQSKVSQVEVETALIQAKKHTDITPFTEGTGKTFNNAYSYSSQSKGLIGAMVIHTNIPMSAYMTAMQISGYNYVGTSSEIGLRLSFYAYQNTTFLQMSYTSTGNYKIDKVRLAVRDGKIAIIIGDVTNKWDYPKLLVDKVQVGYNNPSDTIKDGWTTSILTDLTGYDMTEVPNGRILEDVDGANKKISDYDKDVVQPIVSTISTMSTSITQTQKEIALKASKTDLDAITGRVANAEASITQTAGSIVSTVSGAIKDINVGGTNLLRKTAVETANWGNTTVVGDVAGYRALKSSRSTTSSNRYFSLLQTLGLSNPYRMGIGESYTLSGWFYVDSSLTENATDQNKQFFIRCANGSDTSKIRDVILNVSDAEKNKWVKMERTFVADQFNSIYQACLAITGTGTVYFRDIKLERGNKATDWSPAPEDYREEMSEKVESINIGGKNFIKNSNTFKGWFASHNGSVISFEEGVENPNWKAKDATKVTISKDTGTSNLRTTPTVTGLYSEEFVYSFWAKNLSDKPLVMNFNGFNIKSHNMKEYVVGSANYKLLEPNEEKRVIIKGSMRSDYEWFQHQVYILSDREGYNNDVSFLIWRRQLERGNKATDWTPAPEDIDTSIGDVRTSIDNLEIGGRNLIKLSENPSFAPNNNNTSPMTVQEILTESEPFYRHTPSIKNISMYRWLHGFTPVEMLKKGERYTMSLSVRAVGANATVEAYVRSSKTPLYRSDATYYDLKADEWTRVSFTITPPKDILMVGDGYLLNLYSENGVPIDTKRIKFEKGNRATDWTPANEDIDSRIKDNQTQISQTKESVAITARETVTTAMNNLQIGGRNLARNTNVSGFGTRYGNSNITNQPLDDGTSHVAYRATATTTGAWGVQQVTASRLMDLKKGEEYMLSFKARANKTGFNLNYVYIMNDSGSNQSVSSDGDISLGTDWKTYTFLFKFAKENGTKSSVMVSSESTHVVGDWFDVKDIKVEKGNKATDWSPAPEDVSKRVEEAEAQLSIHAKSIESKVTTTDVDTLISTSKSIKDTRDKNELPSWYFTNYPRQIAEEFKRVETMGVKSLFEDSSMYGHLTTRVKWSDKSGGTVKQILTTDVATYEREGDSMGTSWNPWKKMVDQVTMGSYVTQTLDSWGVNIVRSGDIIAAIRASTEGVKIQGDKIDILGNTTFTSTQSTANAAKSTAETAKSTAETAVSDASTANSNAIAAISDATKAQKLANLTSAKLLYEDVKFQSGNNNVTVYNNTSGSTGVSIARIERPSDCPTTSTHILEVTHTGNASPNYGGIYQNITSRAGAKFLVKYLIKMPTGRTLQTASNSMGSGYKDEWLTSNAGTGAYTEYIRLVTCGTTGTFSTGGHLSVGGGTAPTATVPLKWQLASIECYDLTDYQAVPTSIKNTVDTAETWKMTGKTTINGGRIEADTIAAAQIKAGSITANEIATNAITATKIHADAINGKTIIGANIRTSETANTKGGVVINSSGIFGYNQTGVQKVKIGITGVLEATDAILSGRITASEDSTFAGSISTGKDVVVGENIYMTYNHANRFDQKGIYFYYDDSTPSPTYESKILGTYLGIDIINKNMVTVRTPVFNVDTVSTRFSGGVNFNSTTNYALTVNNAKAKFALGADFTGGTVNFTGATVTGFTPSFG